jgi:hypothetical protein
MSNTCSICLDEINVAVTGCVTLSCGHHNHLSCISKWFYSQEKSSCPLCRAGMEGAGDVWVSKGDEEDEEDEDEDDDEDDDEDEDEEEDARFIPQFATFNNAEFNTMLVEYGLRPVPADMWHLFTRTYMVVQPEYPGELRVRMWQYDLENYFLGRGEKYLSHGMWDAIIEQQKACSTGAFLSATSDFTLMIGLPLQPYFRPPNLSVSLHLMDTGAWQVVVMNPEEDTGVSCTAPAAAMSSATKIQAVWRGFKARVDRVFRAGAA